MLADFEAGAHAQLERDLLPQLHPQEQARYHAFKHARRRQLWLAGRELLLAALTLHLQQVDVSALRTDVQGAVRYHHGGVCVSLSHCRDLLAAALSSIDVGVDIEWPRPRACVAQAQRLFTAAETQYLRGLPQTAQQTVFYILWTLKEAIAKAAGLSVWDSLRNAEFDLHSRRFMLHAPFIKESWDCVHAGIEPGWRLAVASQGIEDLSQMECWRRDAAGQWRRLTLHQPAMLHSR